jgi:hypothetical protein
MGDGRWVLGAQKEKAESRDRSRACGSDPTKVLALHAVEHLLDALELRLDIASRRRRDEVQPARDLYLCAELGRRSNCDAHEVETDSHHAACLAFGNV